MSDTYYLVCFHEDLNQEGADFISECLTRPQTEGGAELICSAEKWEEGCGGLILHISASPERLNQIASDMDLKKFDNNEVLRKFEANEHEQFPPLTLSEKHKCVLYAMEMVHFDQEDSTLPGHAKVKIMKRAPVLNAYQENGFLDMFPLHDEELLKRLKDNWLRGPMLEPPINEIRDYFGENVALYVSFTSFYTKFLIPMAIFGILHYCLDRFLRFDFIYNNLLFALYNLVSVTIFLELWKRKSNEHAFYFGTQGKLRHKRPRPAFRGDFQKNPITGREEVVYPFNKTLKKIIFVSLPITLICLLIAFILMLLSFETERLMMEYLTDQETGIVAEDFFSQVLAYLPSVVYSILVLVMNMKYLHLAHYLSEWENHRTQEQFERHVVIKLILFEFVNTFLALFYIAFVLQDVPMLKSQLFTMLIVMQIVNQIQETILPILLRRPSPRRVMNKICKKIHEKSQKIRCCHKEVECLSAIQDDFSIKIAKFSLLCDPYESTYDDFMEIWLQFGHVFLFSSVYPLAGFFALLNNFMELRMDAYKLCKLMRKPTPRGVRDIGAWYMAFNLTALISVITNLALLSMDKDVQAFAPDSSSRNWILFFVAIEHIMLSIRFALDKVIPDVPKNIKDKMDKNEFLLSRNC